MQAILGIVLVPRYVIAVNTLHRDGTVGMWEGYPQDTS